MYSNEDYLLPCINALLYIGLLVFAIKSKHGILIMISVIWLVCALFGILYSMVPFTLTSYDITIEPYIYMFILFIHEPIHVEYVILTEIGVENTEIVCSGRNQLCANSILGSRMNFD